MSPKHWQASYGNVAKDINPDAYTSVVQMMEEAMQRFADRPAFRCAGQTLSYAQVDKLSRDFAAYLQSKLGVKKGDRIAVMTPNLLAFPIAFLGIARAGAAQVNVNPLYTPHELQHQLNDADVETIVVFSGVVGTVAEVLPKTKLKNVITNGVGDGSGVAIPSPPVDPRLKDSITLADALAEGAQLPFTPVALNGDDLLFLQYTGGTTGLSKGAALSHRNLVANVEQFKAFMGGDTCARRGGHRHRHSAVSHLRADGELHHLLHGRRRQLAGAEPARLRQLHRHPEEGPPERLHGREHAVRRAGGPSEVEGSRLVEPEAGRRRRRGGDRRGVRQVAGDDRHLHPRRLRPVRNQPGGQLQPDCRCRPSPAPPGCRCRPPTSSCSTTTATRSPSARPARSSSRARR